MVHVVSVDVDGSELFEMVTKCDEIAVNERGRRSVVIVIDVEVNGSRTTASDRE